MLESDPVTGITPNRLNYTEIDNLLDDVPVCSTVGHTGASIQSTN